MEIIKDECHWCESLISRPSINLLWIDDYESADCEFHPLAFDSITLKPTGHSAPHQTTGEVYAVIVEHEKIKRMQRDKTIRLRAVDSNVISLGSSPQRTSRTAANNILPRTGSMRRQVYDLIKQSRGRTDFELEGIMKGKHQTVSASRRSLVIDGWIIDSGETKQNEQGNDCIVWVAADFNNGMLFGNV
jgi:hypothetical protein